MSRYHRNRSRNSFSKLQIFRMSKSPALLIMLVIIIEPDSGLTHPILLWRTKSLHAHSYSFIIFWSCVVWTASNSTSTDVLSLTKDACVFSPSLLWENDTELDEMKGKLAQWNCITIHQGTMSNVVYTVYRAYCSLVSYVCIFWITWWCECP